jgi:hypothetical protein
MYIVFVVDFLFLDFFHIMTYTGTSSAYETIVSGNSKRNLPEEEHIYEEQPYYSIDRPISGKSTSGAYQRTGGVC